MKHQEATTRMYKIMKRYLKPDQNGCCNFITVSDHEKLKTLIQQTVTHYQRTGEDQKGALAIMLYHIMSDERNGVTKFIHHRRAATKEDVENKLLDHFGRHFSQAHTTPCPQPSLDKLNGFTAEGPFAAQLKKGTADVNSVPVDGFTKDVLKKCNGTNNAHQK